MRATFTYQFRNEGYGEIFDIERKKGLTYMFLSFVNHRVSPVTKGIRYSLVGWYEGPDWR